MTKVSALYLYRKRGIYYLQKYIPKDLVPHYGVAKWDNRSIEALIIDITINMKNDDLGKYDNTCWTIASIDDKEFGRLRSPNIHKCGDQLSENDWMNMHSFETKWDLGVEN